MMATKYDRFAIAWTSALSEGAEPRTRLSTGQTCLVMKRSTRVRRSLLGASDTHTRSPAGDHHCTLGHRDPVSQHRVVPADLALPVLTAWSACRNHRSLRRPPCLVITTGEPSPDRAPSPSCWSRAFRLSLSDVVGLWAPLSGRPTRFRCGPGPTWLPMRRVTPTWNGVPPLRLPPVPRRSPRGLPWP